MSDVTISTNFPEFQRKMENLSKRKLKAVVDALNKGAVLVHKTAVKSVQQSSGQYRLYEFEIRSIGGKVVPLTGIPRPKHYSSPPDKPPNTDSGNLVSNILITRRADTTSPVAFVVSRARYSSWLEKGTKNMKPRPFMGPALEKNSDAIKKLIREALRS